MLQTDLEMVTCWYKMLRKYMPFDDRLREWGCSAWRRESFGGNLTAVTSTHEEVVKKMELISSQG